MSELGGTGRWIALRGGEKPATDRIGSLLIE
jgi:hypothetical protein